MKMKKYTNLQNESILTGNFKNEKEINKFLINDDNKLIQKLLEKYYCNQITHKKQLTVKQIGSCGDIVNSADLGINSPNQKDLDKINPKISIELIISEIFPEQGKIKIHVRVEENKKIKNKLFIISGYKTLQINS